MRESVYQGRLIKKLRKLFPEAIVIKGPSEYIQGIPDILILFSDTWAALEVKVSSTSDEQPNQRYYVEKMNEMAYAAFIYPENESEVLDGLQRAFGSRR